MSKRQWCVVIMRPKVCFLNENMKRDIYRAFLSKTIIAYMILALISCTKTENIRSLRSMSLTYLPLMIIFHLAYRQVSEELTRYLLFLEITDKLEPGKNMKPSNL